jgi:hypothetical protein
MRCRCGSGFPAAIAGADPPERDGELRAARGEEVEPAAGEVGLAGYPTAPALLIIDGRGSQDTNAVSATPRRHRYGGAFTIPVGTRLLGLLTGLQGDMLDHGVRRRKE